MEKLLPDWLQKAQSISDSETLLWELCSHISLGLSLEDCVIYIYDNERKTLTQKAVYGKKRKDNYSIIRPIEIPPGVGIVGRVAKTGKPEIVNDTRLDPDYVIDDSIRLSEMAIPLFAEGKLIGVFDSESSEIQHYSIEMMDITSQVLKAATFHFLYLKQKEELDFMASFAGQIPFAMLRIDQNLKIIRHNRSAQPLIRKWGNKSGYLSDKKLRFSPNETIQERKWIEFTGDKYFLIHFQKDGKEKVANVFGYDVTQIHGNYQAIQKLLGEYSEIIPEQFAIQLSNQILINYLEKQAHYKVEQPAFHIKTKSGLENILRILGNNISNQAHNHYSDIASALKKTKDALFEICHLKNVRVRVEIDERVNDRLFIPYLNFHLLLTSIVYEMAIDSEECTIQIKIDLKENASTQQSLKIMVMRFNLNAGKPAEPSSPVSSSKTEAFSSLIDLFPEAGKWNLFRSENRDFYEFEILGTNSKDGNQELFL